MWWLLTASYKNNSMKTHQLNHRHNGREKEICGCHGLLAASYITQFNESSPPKVET